MDHNLIAEYSGARVAARSVGVDSSCIIRCCNGENKTSKGYIWSYERNKYNEIIGNKDQ